MRAALKPNITLTREVSPQCARVMIRRITGSASLGKDQLDMSATCPQCDHPAGSPDPAPVDPGYQAGFSELKSIALYGGIDPMKQVL